MNIAAQLYTVRDRMHDPSQVEAVLARLREIGYAAVEVAGLGADVAANFGDLLKASGIFACAAHVGLDRLVDDLNTVTAECVSWGCEYVVIPSLPVEYHSGSGFRRLRAEAEIIAGRLAPSGLQLAYHNHAFELATWGGRTGLEILFDSARGEALKAELDTYWIQHAGSDAEMWIRRLAGRCPLVHLKDAVMIEGKQRQTAVGEGTLDWPSILRACHEAGTRWLIVEQDETVGDPLDSLAISYRNLVRLLPH